MITCGQTSAVILNGEAGEDGEDAPPSMYTVTEIRDPGGDGPGPDEILLKMANGQYVAWYYGLGLSVLAPGTYVTTDQQATHFTIDSNGTYSE